MRRMLMALLGIIILITTATSFAGDCGDVNNSGTVNALDITYLINFLYKHGASPNCGTVTDIDGNTYQTVKIGNQWWTVENLEVTHYRNGDPIPNVTDKPTWIGLSTGAYCNYNYDEGYVGTYGRLYNWYAVNDSRNVAPVGWHVPTDAEWQTLVNFLGDTSIVGGMMKETGTRLWSPPNTGATNESGFSALPAGYRDFYIGDCHAMRFFADFWSSSEYDITCAWYRALANDAGGVDQFCGDKKYGFSIRCVKD